MYSCIRSSKDGSGIKGIEGVGGFKESVIYYYKRLRFVVWPLEFV